MVVLENRNVKHKMKYIYIHDCTYNKRFNRTNGFFCLQTLCLSECLDINPDCEIACRKLPPKPKCQSHDPRQCDWYCNAKRMNCSNGEEYHCAREVNNKFTDVCAKEVYCLKGNTNVY